MTDWPVPADVPHLTETAVHVWAVPLQVSPRALEPLAATLSEAEQRRARQFKFERHQRRFAAARGALRILLGRYFQTEPAKIEFTYGPRGKPALSPRLAGERLEFNLAHSDELALIAVTRLGPVGVDVERIRAINDADDLVARFFSPRENALFQSVPAADRPAAFFNLWTRKESFLKATGEGIAQSLRTAEVSFLPGEPARLLALGGDTTAAAQWTLFHLTPAAGFVGAVAIRASGVALECRQFGFPEAGKTQS